MHCLLWYQGLHARRPNTGDEEDDDDDEDEGGFQTELQTMLESVTRRMVKSELEDFELVCSNCGETGGGPWVSSKIEC